MCTVAKSYASALSCVQYQCRSVYFTYLFPFTPGGPGSGKGTLCARIMEEFGGFMHISAGDLLRNEVATGTERGKMVKEIMRQGQLVPPEVTVTLLRQEILSVHKEAVGFLIDGFPRKLSQHKIFEEQVRKETAERGFTFQYNIRYSKYYHYC